MSEASKLAEIAARIVQSARDCRWLEKGRPGKLEACERFDPDELDYATGYPGGQATLACPDVTRHEEADSEIILSTFKWCAGCRARHQTTQALYAARRRLRTATDAYEKALRKANA